MSKQKAESQFEILRKWRRERACQRTFSEPGQSFRYLLYKGVNRHPKLALNG